MSLNHGSGGVLGRIVLVCGALTASAGALVLVLWAIGREALTAMGTGYIPMAPNSALLFVLLGSAVVLRGVWPASRTIHHAAAAVALFSALLAGVALIGFAIDLNIDDLLFRTTRMLGKVPIGHMSPVTAFCFLLAGVSLLLLEYQAGTWAAILGTLIMLVGSVCLMGYWFGAPLLYGGTLIPVALPTSLALVALGVGLAAAAGPHTWPLNTLIGPSTRARLLRALLPTVVLLTLLKDWISNILLGHPDPGVVLAAAVTAVSFLLVVSCVVSWVSRVIGDTIDRAEADRKQAEETVWRERDFSTVALNSLPGMFYLFNQAGKFLRWNRNFEQVSEYSAEEIARMHPLDFFAGTEKELIAARIREVFEKGASNAEADFVSKSGLRRPYYFTGHTILVDGQMCVIGMGIDITGRVQAEQELLLLGAALHASANAIMIADIKGNVQWVNPAFTALTGYSTEEVVGKNPRQLVKSGKHDRAFYKNLWDTILAGENWHGETINRRKDGSLYTEDQTITPVRNDRGKITHFIAIKQDITVRKQVENELKLFRSLVDQSNDAIEVINPETGRFLDVNEKGCQDLGYSREEYLTLSVSDIDPNVEQSAWPQIMKELRKSKVLIMESIHRRKDGTTFPVEVNIKYVQLDRDYIIAAVRDITDRKRAEQTQAAAEERYHYLVNSSPSVIYVTSITPPHRCIFVSDTLSRMTGYAPQLMLDDPNFWPSRVHPEDLKQITSELENLLAAGEGMLEYRFRFADGEYHWLRDAFRVIYDSYDKCNEMVGAWTDITAARSTEEQLRQAQKMEAVGQLTGGVAHDFNNRLTVILGNLELLQRRLQDNPENMDMLKSVVSAAEGAADLTRRLLTFSRRQVLEPVVININELMTGMHDMLQRTLGETIKIVVSSGTDLWLIKTDRHLLENVLLNLAVNARDAMPKGGQMTIETLNTTLDADYVRSHVQAAPGEYVQLTVSDTGQGMSEEIKRRVFEPFFTTKPTGKGTGLGLAMVYGFVKQSGGHIDIYSEPGHGTSFKIYLPRDRSTAGTAGVTPEHKAGDEDVVFRGKTILLVEDDAAVREIAVVQLTEMECKVLTADSGPHALEIFNKHTDIDLLFTDMIMPGGITGLELAAKMRERVPGLKVLFTSGYAPQAAADHRTIEHPNDFWLAKPYRIQVLRNAVHRALSEKTRH